MTRRHENEVEQHMRQRSDEPTLLNGSDNLHMVEPQLHWGISANGTIITSDSSRQ